MLNLKNRKGFSASAHKSPYSAAFSFECIGSPPKNNLLARTDDAVTIPFPRQPNAGAGKEARVAAWSAQHGPEYVVPKRGADAVVSGRKSMVAFVMRDQ
jgi:hypothetical protein